MRTAALLLACAGPAFAQCDFWSSTAPVPQTNDRFGFGVDCDGVYLVAGVPGGDAVGAHVLDAATGQHLFQLGPVTTNGIEHSFGSRVAIGGGYILVADDYGSSTPGSYSGSVHLYDSSGAPYFELHSSDHSAGDHLGTGVALHGNRAAVGAAWKADLSSHNGAAYVFDLPTGQQLHRLMPSDPAYRAYFGTSVDLDATRAVVGAPGFETHGKVYVFDLATGQERLQLAGPTPHHEDDSFGSSVDIDGERIVVGDPGRNAEAGAVYVYDATTGLLLYEFHPDGDRQLFGRSVSLDGDLLAVGAWENDEQAPSSGAVYVYDLATGTRLFKRYSPGGASYDFYGFDVAASAGTIFVGAPHFTNGHGSVHAYTTGAPVGSRICGPANPNSSGGPAHIDAYGLTDPSLGCLQLRATELPVGRFGYFLASQSPGFVPFVGGGQGNLCLSGTIGRFVAQAANSGASGSITISVDLEAIPTSPVSVVQPGDSWFFQCWFRDVNPGATSNLTDSVVVTFL